MSDRARSCLGSLAVGVAGLLWAALAWPAAAGPGFSGQGRVVAVDPARGTMVVDHEGIAGLLPAGRSEFGLDAALATRGLRAGQRVRFALGTPESAHGLLTVAAFEADPPPAGAAWAPVAAVAGLAGLLLAALVALLVMGAGLWRALRAMKRQLVGLDHEMGMLRRRADETRDRVERLAAALDQVGTVLLAGYVQQLRRLEPVVRPRADAPPPPPGPALVVVQRGRGEVFRAIEREQPEGLRLIWDRRRGERRASQHTVALDRREGERRATPPDTWARLGFLVAPGAGESSGDGADGRPRRADGRERRAPRP
jgi:hypothetical protein